MRIKIVLTLPEKHDPSALSPLYYVSSIFVLTDESDMHNMWDGSMDKTVDKIIYY